MGASHLSLRDRFYRHVEKTEGCWIWRGFVDGPRRLSSPTLGYGYFRVEQSVRKAHRVAWEIEVGPIPDGLSVLHRCDNTTCVRAPDHLFLGTQADNMRDMRAKGRFVSTKGVRRVSYHGEAHPAAKITENDVREIRRLRAEGRTLQSLADQYGLVNSAIHNIISRTTWKHVL